MCLVHVKIKSLVEIKMMCVEKFVCDGKVESLKKKFETKQGPSIICIFNRGLYLLG